MPAKKVAKKSVKKAAKKTAKRSTKKAANTAPAAKKAAVKKTTTHKETSHAPSTIATHASPQKTDKRLATIIIASFVVLIIAVLFLGFDQWQSVDSHATDEARAVAHVNGYPISAQDLEEIGLSVRQLDPSASDEVILNQTALVILLRNLAAEKGITADEQEITLRADERNAYLLSVYSEEQFAEVLAEAGLTEEAFQQAQRTAIEDDIIIGELLRQEVYDTIEQTSEATALAYYRDNQQSFSQPEQRVVRHILICYQGANRCEDGLLKEDALREIEDVKALLDEDVTRFAELAQEYSTGPSGPQGGLLGPATRGAFVAPFENAAFALSVGQVSDVVETQFGYHLILIDDIIPATVVAFEDVQETIQQQLDAENLQTAQREYVTALMEGVEIVTHE